MIIKMFSWRSLFLIICLISYLTTNASFYNKVFIIPIPKCGTHLLAKYIGALVNTSHIYTVKKRGKELVDFINSSQCNSFHAHLTYDENDARMLSAANNIKILFLIRDPRDYVVSLAYYMKKNPHLWPHAPKHSLDELIIEIIVGSDRLQRELGNLNEYYRFFMPWAAVPGVYTVRFEDLIGPQGGGSRDKQIEEIKKIALHIGIQVDDSKIDKISNEMFGNSLTFRSGKIGSWKSHFKDEHKKLFKEIAGQLLIDLGYENDFDW